MQLGKIPIQPFSIPFYSQLGHGGLEPIPANFGREAGYTLDRSPVHRRATQRQTSTHTHTLTPMGNLEEPIHLTCMSLECGRKPENLEKTHISTRRTYKLFAERP